MMVFPWLVLALALVVLAAIVASTPSGARWLRSRGAAEFAYPSRRAVGLVLFALVLLLGVWYALAGPPD